MKTFKILITGFVVLCMAFGISNAQNKKTTETYFWPYECPVPCTDDYMVGEESCVVTTWDGKYFCKYEGIYTGTGISPKIYKMSAFEIGSVKGGKASNETFILKGVLMCEGVRIAICNYKFHITINANGQITVEKEKGAYWEWICL